MITFLNKQPRQNPQRELIHLKVLKVRCSLPVASHVKKMTERLQDLKSKKKNSEEQEEEMEGEMMKI